MHKPSVAAPVIGVTKPEHITDAVAATEIALSEAAAPVLTVDNLEIHFSPVPGS